MWEQQLLRCALDLAGARQEDFHPAIPEELLKNSVGQLGAPPSQPLERCIAGDKC